MSGRQDGAASPARSERGVASEQRRKLFLDHLAATCNVQAAAEAAGATTTVFYKHRRADAAFAAAWAAAVQAGYDRLEEALLAKALADVAAYEFDPGAVAVELVDGAAVRERTGRAGLHTSAGFAEKVARIDVQLALTLLNRRAAIEARGRERHSRRRPTAQEVETALTAKLDALARRLAPPER